MYRALVLPEMQLVLEDPALRMERLVGSQRPLGLCSQALDVPKQDNRVAEWLR